MKYYIINSENRVLAEADTREEAEELLHKKYSPEYIKKQGLRVV